MKYYLKDLSILVVVTLCIIIAMAFASCNCNKEELENRYKPNGEGFAVNWNGSTDKLFFYLSAYRVLQISLTDNACITLIPGNTYLIKELNNTNLLYEDIKEALMWEYDTNPNYPLKITINAETNWSEYPYSEIRGLVEKLKTLRNQYRYYSYDGHGHFYVYDRIHGMPFFEED